LAEELKSRVEDEVAAGVTPRAGARHDAGARHVVTPVPVAARPAGQTSRAEKRAEAAARAEDGGPPVVRVTIGRVEVRAVTPPAQSPAGPAAKKRAAPTLSLEDYLKQRRGERG
jgi:hypothetical protein